MSNVVAFPTELEAPALVPAGFEEMPLIMSPRTLGSILDVHPRTLDRWRVAGEGPVAHQMPGSGQWRYHRSDVIAWWSSTATKGAK